MEELYGMFCDNYNRMLDEGADPISEEVLDEGHNAALAYCVLKREGRLKDDEVFC